MADVKTWLNANDSESTSAVSGYNSFGMTATASESVPESQPPSVAPDASIAEFDDVTVAEMTQQNAASAEGKKEARLRKFKERLDQSIVEKQYVLSQAKGCGQITVTIALFLANVTLLKSVIHHGPEHASYYSLCLVLLCVSMVLLLVAAAMCIAIEYTMSYLLKCGEQGCEDCRDYCCMTSCRHKKAARKPSIDDDDGENEEDVMLKERNLEAGADADYIILDDEVDLDPSTSGCRCCPNVCRSNVYGHYENQTLQKYYKWKSLSIENELIAIRVEEEIGYFDRVIEKTQKKIDVLSAKQGGRIKSADQKDAERQVKDLQAVLKSVQVQKEEKEEILRKAALEEIQACMMKALGESIRRQRIVRVTTFWQALLNYLFYGIFIVNIFIIGFCCASNTVLSHHS